MSLGTTCIIRQEILGEVSIPASGSIVSNKSVQRLHINDKMKQKLKHGELEGKKKHYKIIIIVKKSLT